MMLSLFYRRAVYPYIKTPKCITQRWLCTVPPEKRHVVLFPGQGSQFVGMTKTMENNKAVKKLFKTANEILGYNILEKCLHGPQDELDKTVYCQPAIFLASLAALELYKDTFPESDLGSENMVTAGFSVGEYAALVLSKSLTFEDALKLLDIRAQAMQSASEETQSGMVTVRGLDEQGIKSLLKTVEDYLIEKKHQDKTLSVANYLYPKGFVLAGHEEAIEYVLKFGVSKHGASRATRLPVSGAFHTPIMKSARDILENALTSVNVQFPKIKVYCNVTGKPYESAEEIKSLLPRQLAEPVRWHDIMLNICASDNQQTFYELGPGRQLTSILANINRRLVKNAKNIEA